MRPAHIFALIASLTFYLTSASANQKPVVIQGPGQHQCALANNRLSCWGDNTYGQLGIGVDSLPVTSPQPVQLPPGKIRAVALGRYHTCAIVEGSVYCWGRNTFGQAGRPAPAFLPSPAQVPGMERDVQALAAGDDFTCALKGAQVWCWGNNMLGSVGDGSNIHRYTPTLALQGPVGQLIAAGASACAIAAGNALCWGEMARSNVPRDLTPAALTVQRAEVSAGQIALITPNRCRLLLRDGEIQDTCAK